MKVLLTGGAGFIGSHLTEQLLGRGYDVCCVDNFNTYYDPSIKRRNIQLFIENPQYTLYEGNIVDFQFLESIFKKEKFDRVIHLAARAGVRPSITDPDLYNRVNVIGTTNLLNLSKTTGVEQFIFGSSSSVYGVNSKVPFSEDDSIDKPISPYAATKIAGEMLCHVYHYLYGLHITSLRFFTVYGPRQRPEMAIHKFARAIMDGTPIPVFGDGSSRRDYTFVDDIVAGIMASFDENHAYEVFNLGNSNTVSLAELIETLETAIGKKAVISRMENQPGDVPITYANIDKARTKLGFEPRTGIKEGITRFVEWLREQP
ncbi:MAG: GDP-mannose 4,6-dehydratase [Candidatus Auribacterota bacterium]